MMVHFIGLFLPLVISNILHMVVVKKNLLAFLKIPINKVMFGQNKTWRGMIFVPLMNAFIHYFLNGQEPKLLLYGAIYGLAYTLSELPNSWVKRRLNIRSGERS